WKLYNLALRVGRAEVAHGNFDSASNSLAKNRLLLNETSRRSQGEASQNLWAPRAPFISTRGLLDRALHSDQFWWASHSPCWHPKMIERGARMLRDVEMLDPRVGEKEKRQAQKLYNDIILTGRKLYGEEIIPC
ncbi:MAG: hypothetical protein LiPW16_320, partial [Microgenomates group bacterium LiPW_16]